jgi:hypothetical protein
MGARDMLEVVAVRDAPDDEKPVIVFRAGQGSKGA